ncbi:SDR family NAD(P)-dependent oxidoreductase [Microlunatus speluncae]|uniref:SDR family NAD(P)-dependent oxidoreductase n=1 Tax=Microlunatus speluncae TaxID=2594267 RepID=UPI0012664092|nr:SDR family oxidoreductase [Microlunatus speluncae]
MHVVTGGGTGIGRAIALSLSQDGQRVLIAGRRAAPLEAVVEQGAGRIEAVACDLSVPAGARILAARLSGVVEGLVHCAGGNPAIGRPEPRTLEDEAALAADTLAGNLVSTALTVTAVEDRLSNDASIVLFGSIAAEHGVGYYGPAKAAVASYAVGLAARLGPRGVRVNCVSPGYIAETEFFAGLMTPERAAELRAQTAIDRTGVPADAVGLTRFLLSSHSRHLTGQNLHLNGGAFTTR